MFKTPMFIKLQIIGSLASSHFNWNGWPQLRQYLCVHALSVIHPPIDLYTQIFFFTFYFRNQCNDVHGHTRIRKKNVLTNRQFHDITLIAKRKRWSLVHDSTIIGLEICKRKQFRLALIEFFFYSDLLHFVMSMWLSICIRRFYVCFFFFNFILCVCPSIR